MSKAAENSSAKSIIGHRGACAYAPENTLASFDKALALGCDFIEFDVMCSSEGQAFVFHDHSLQRTSNGQGEVGLVTAAYLQSLDAGSWFDPIFQGEPIPTFQAALAWLSATGVQANIEIKPYPRTTEQTTKAIVAELHQGWPKNKDKPLISSFEWEALMLCKQLAPEMPLGLLLHRWDRHWLKKANLLACYSIHLNKKILTADRVYAMKDQGYKVYAYTVNQKSQALRLYEWGVDAVFSDYPDLLLK